MIDFKDIYIYYRDLLQGNRAWIKFASKWFAVSALAGFAAFFLFPDLLIRIVEMFEERFGADPSLNWGLAEQIFLQNIMASGIALFGGILLGAAPFLGLVFNGFLIGYVFSSVIFLSGPEFLANLGLFAAGIIPHGIIEIPAIILACAFGLRLGANYLQADRKGRRIATLTADLRTAFLAAPLLIAMLALAAVIEVFVSGNLVK